MSDDAERVREASRRLVPYWNAVQRAQVSSGHTHLTDADMLVGLLDVGGSILVRIIEADGQDLEAARMASAQAQTAEAAGVHGRVLGLTDAARRVSETMFEEARVRGGQQRQEYVLLGLLLSGGVRVKAVLADLGIDRERVLRELRSSAPDGV
jgi:hypothetical protein